MVFSDRLHSHSGIKRLQYLSQSVEKYKYMADQISKLFTTFKQAGEFSNVATVQLAELKEELRQK